MHFALTRGELSAMGLNSGLGGALTDNEKASPGTLSAATAGYSFAGFRLEPDGTLLRGKTVVHLPPKELAALELLLSHAGQVVTTQQLRTELWGDAHVTG